jgi:peptidoglycan-N-acetylglucosamine deacetylase
MTPCFSHLAYSKEIAITFDDSPRHAKGYFDGNTRSKKLIDELRSHHVKQVAFFSVSERLNKEGIERLNRYAKAGHIIANHTHSHPNINQLTLENFSQDFLMAHNKLKSFDNYSKLFRFPYLREGDTRLKRDGMRQLLQEHGYRNAYITLNNYDWYIEVLFQRAIKKGEEVDMGRMKAFYVDTLMESIEYYDQMAVTRLGRSPKHVLLLHEMDISALFIGDLVDELRKRGWSIISPLEAYKDEIADYQIDTPLKYNPGRIGEIARDKGQKTGLWHHTLDEKYLDEMFSLRVLD